MVEGLLRDVRFGARSLRRSRGFTAAAVLTLALGIGAATAVFSVVYGVLFRPLPFPNADRLVQIVQVLPARGAATQPSRAGLTAEQVTEWQATSRSFAAIGQYTPTWGILTNVTSPVRMNGASVSVPLFRALGVRPAEGRLFADDEELPGNNAVVILSHGAWTSRFASATNVLGQSITLNDRPYRVIGVMPRGFGFPSLASTYMSLNSSGELSDAPEFWVPRLPAARPSGPAKGGMTLRQTLALLRPGVSVEEATAEASTLMQATVRERFRVELVSARDEQARDVRPVLLMFQTAVLFVLFIACVNVVNLMLARAASRRQDLAVRLALGASRLQIARYALSEGVLIATAGGVLGSLLAFEIVAVVAALPPYVLPRLGEIRLDGTALAFAAGMSLLAGLVVGLATSLRMLRSDARPGRFSWRALIIAESAASVIVLAGAALLLTSFVKLTSVDRGFDADRVFTFRVALPARYANLAAFDFHDRFAATLRQIPGVTSVAASANMFGTSNTGFALSIDGTRVPNAAIGFQHLTPGTFATLGVPLRGRDFTAADRLPAARTAIVNETFAAKFFPGRDAIGQQIQFQDWTMLEIVGVAGDTRTRELDRAVAPSIYLPEEVNASSFAASTYVMQSTSPDSLGEAIRAAAAQLNPNAVIYDASRMDILLARIVTTPKVYSATATGFAVTAVILAALGLFGVLSYSVRTRTREFGIRIALGASPRTVITSVMRDALGTVAVGLAIGIAGAVYLSRFLETLLFGIRPGDPATLAGVALLFAAIAALAAYVPARRATRVDPLVALRAE